MPSPSELKFDPITAGWTYIRWLGDRNAIEQQTMTWDKTIVDRSAELSSWVDFCYQVRKRGVLVYAFANNHFPATRQPQSNNSGASGKAKVSLRSIRSGQHIANRPYFQHDIQRTRTNTEILAAVSRNIFLLLRPPGMLRPFRAYPAIPVAAFLFSGLSLCAGASSATGEALARTGRTEHAVQAQK